MNEFRQSGKTILFVTHDLSRIETWCDSAVWIDGGTTRMVGDPRQVVALYRQAVAAAEAEGERLGHSALSTPGVALPEVAAVAPAKAPVVSVTDVRLLDAHGVQPSAVSPEASLHVCIDVLATQSVDSSVGVEVATVSGLSLFKVQTALGVIPEGTTTARLCLRRLGLGEGAHVVTATAWSGETTPHALSKTLVVAPHGSAVGHIRPEYSWTVERQVPQEANSVVIPSVA
jgi:hypothetical protein